MAHLSKPLLTMKRILILLLALIPIITSAQGLEIDHESKSVRWAKIYETDMTQEEIFDQILASGILDNVVTYGNMIAGDLPPVKLDYESLGYKRMNLPLYISNDRFGCRIIFRFKEGRYKAEAIGMFFQGDAGSISAGRTSLYEYKDTNFKDVPRIIMSHLIAITSFSPLEDF